MPTLLIVDDAPHGRLVIEARNRALKAGANEVIVKPLNKVYIQNAVSRLVEGIPNKEELL